MNVNGVKVNFFLLFDFFNLIIDIGKQSFIYPPNICSSHFICNKIPNYLVCNTEIYTSIWTVSSTAVFVPLSKSFLSYIHQTSHRCVLPKILLLDVKIKCCKTCWIQTSKHYIYKKSVQFGCIYYAIMDIYIIVIYY